MPGTTSTVASPRRGSRRPVASPPAARPRAPPPPPRSHYRPAPPHEHRGLSPSHTNVWGMLPQLLAPARRTPRCRRSARCSWLPLVASPPLRARLARRALSLLAHHAHRMRWVRPEPPAPLPALRSPPRRSCPRRPCRRRFCGTLRPAPVRDRPPQRPQRPHWPHRSSLHLRRPHPHWGLPHERCRVGWLPPWPPPSTLKEPLLSLRARPRAQPRRPPDRFTPLYSRPPDTTPSQPPLPPSPSPLDREIGGDLWPQTTGCRHAVCSQALSRLHGPAPAPQTYDHRRRLRQRAECCRLLLRRCAHRRTTPRHDHV